MRDLEYFDVIARTQNLGQAAELIGRTKPALTKCIRRLEDAIGTPLFMRSGRGIVLTAVGRMLLDRVGQLRTHTEEVVRELRDFADGTAGHVRIGVGATPAQQILPDIAASLIANMPTVSIEIVIGINNVLRESLRAGNLDLVVGPLGAPAEAEFVTHPLLSDDVVVAANPDHPLLRTQPSLAAFAERHWALPARPAGQRTWLDRIFISHGLPTPKVQIETNSLFLLTDLIARTDLLSFMPRRHLWPHRPEAPLREVSLAATTMHRSFGVMYRDHAYLPPPARRIVALLRDAAQARSSTNGTP